MSDITNRGQKPPVGFTRREVEVNGRTVVYYIGGDGPPLLFLHGGGTFHGIDFAREWTAHFTVIAPFHPGFGESAADDSVENVEALLDHYEVFVDALGLKSLYLAGISLGGWLSAEFALRHPDMVKKLVLSTPGGLFDASVPMPDLSTLSFEELLAYLAHDPAVFDPYLPKMEAEQQAFMTMLGDEGASIGKLMPQGPFRPGMEKDVNQLTMPVITSIMAI